MGEIDRCIDQCVGGYVDPSLLDFIGSFMGQYPLPPPWLEVESYMFKDAEKKAEVLSRNAMLRLLLERRTMEELQDDRCSNKNSELGRGRNVWLEQSGKTRRSQ